MTQTAKPDVFIYIGRDGGTGKHLYSDCKQAYASVSAQDKRRAFIMLAAAAITLCFLLLSRLFELFKPLLDKVYYGMLTEVLYYIILGVTYTLFIIVLNEIIKDKTGVRLFRPRGRQINAARAYGVIAVAAVAVFTVSASLGFKLKMQYEMGMGIPVGEVLVNISVYFYYAFHLWLGFTAASLVQYGMSILFPAKYTVPWGAIFLTAVYGLIEFALEALVTTHMFPEYYYLLTYAYAAIFVLTGRSYHIGYWASVVVMIL